MTSRQYTHRFVIRKCRPCVAARGRHFGQRGRDVQLRHGCGCRTDALGVFGGDAPHFAEKFLLERQDLLLGIEHFALVLLELGRGEPLGIDQCLLTLVIGRRQVLVGLGDLDVITEYVVETDLQRLNAGARPFARFDLRNVLPTVLAQVAQLIELAIVARSNGPAIYHVHRRRVRDCVQNAVAHFRHFVELPSQRRESLRLPPFDGLLERRNFFERSSERQQLARPGGPDRYLRQEPLDVQHRAQFAAHLRAHDRVPQQIADCIQPRFDLTAVQRRAEQAPPQEPSAHTGHRLIDH